MRINSVTARAFGPLVDATLEFADGLTIVFGPNESAKSASVYHTRSAVPFVNSPRDTRSFTYTKARRFIPNSPTS